jgi:phosphoserine phosphatase
VYTGEIVGDPCFREGKILCLNRWLSEVGRPMGQNLDNAWFYSDSHNDLPLLEAVANPVAVDADNKLSRIAIQRGWPLISLR